MGQLFWRDWKIALFSLLFALCMSGSVRAAPTPDMSDAPPALTKEEMTVPEELSFENKIKRHSGIVSKADAIRLWAIKKRDAVWTANGTARDYAFYNEEWLNANKVLLPYGIANEQATDLRKESYVLNIPKEAACRKGNDCITIDVMTATMMFYQEISERGKQTTPATAAEEPSTTVTCGKTQIKVEGLDVCLLADFLRDKPLDMVTFGILPAVRDFIIPKDDNGEVAKFIRDPGKRPIQILKDLRDSIVDKNDNGEGAKILRDPIKCTVGHLFGSCD